MIIFGQATLRTGRTNNNSRSGFTAFWKSPGELVGDPRTIGRLDQRPYQMSGRRMNRAAIASHREHEKRAREALKLSLPQAFVISAPTLSEPSRNSHIPLEHLLGSGPSQRRCECAWWTFPLSYTRTKVEQARRKESRYDCFGPTSRIGTRGAGNECLGTNMGCSPEGVSKGRRLRTADIPLLWPS